MLDWSITSGPIGLLALVAGLLSLVYLLVERTPSWWTRRLPLAGAIGIIVAAAVKFTVDEIWRPFPDGFSWLATVWIGITATAVALVPLRRHTVRRVAVGSVAALLVAVCGLAQVNGHFGAFPTVRALVGAPLANQIPFDRIPGPVADLITPPAGSTLASIWSPPAGMPASGLTTTTNIPGPVSGFHARDAWIYLPPAYLATPRPVLPVLILLAGQPGSPRDWFNGGDLNHTMSDFAAAHDGLAPVVVSVDTLGGTLQNPLCMDSKRGNSFSYLTIDVPDWIRTHLQVSSVPAQWAAGGFSAGGTCSLQLAVNAPQVYPLFIDIAGEREPNLSTPAITVREMFNGDRAAFEKINPVDVLARQNFPNSAGVIVAGTVDVYRPDAQLVLAATRNAGMQMTYIELPGDHSFSVWRPGLVESLPWLAAHTGLS